ncbi:hypothetical protein R1flu_005502 [Riccia fluitans]|uniref:leucine--tRNA ligase n=1 Tax=Riccia fluitans TaxID=41844 RepID=A0ABD1YTD1_9MARC
MGPHSLACCNACLLRPRIRGEFLNVPFIRNFAVFGRIPSPSGDLRRDRKLAGAGLSNKTKLKSRIYSDRSVSLATLGSFSHGTDIFCRAAVVGSSSRQVHCNATLNTPPIQLEHSEGESIGQEVEPVKIKQYPFAEVEAKWQQVWEEEQTFRTPDLVDTSKPKYYVLDMFPYPSGAGLHVGHPEGYTATDIMARYKRMKGFNVLHPMGWDAFGLPAEQYAIQTGTHPRKTTFKNIDRFRSQLKALGFSYDWQRELSTTEPDYYKWTQWIFLQLFNRGLAYQAEVPVNWCPELGTVLANEEVIDGVSERGGFPVIRKPMKQWMLKITAYADRLLEDLDELDWPESIKDMQRNWIGRSEGAEVDFEVLDTDGQPSSASVRVFTTRPDTLCGATYLVVAPEHPILKQIVSSDQKELVEKYVDAASRKSDLERTELQKDKTGVFTGAMARNPANGEAIPIWVADYVLGSYGTGAIMAVPAHDTRDHEFAVTFNLPIRVVVSSGEGDELVGDKAYTGGGSVVNSALVSAEVQLNGLPNTEAAEKITQWLEKIGKGKKKVNYKLRDWLFARQRYWGEPFPIVFFEDSNEARGVAEADLPVTLPDIDDFTPTGTGEPPLAKAASWVTYIDEESGKAVRRETNTMPQWAGSCWYYLRFMDPKNSKAPVDSEKERYWGPVDLYVGGAEHSVLHLLYARFWHKVLYDIGVVSTKEPFQRLVNQGMILGEVEYTTYRDADGSYVSADSAGEDCVAERISEKDVLKFGEGYVLKYDQSIKVSARAHKMSKSRGNVINPDEIVRDYGADSLRLYEMFMGPLRDTKVWSTNGVEGVYRFLGRAWRLVVGMPSAEGSYSEGSLATDVEPSLEQLKALHRCIYRVTDDIEGMRFNTSIAGMMEFINAASKWNDRPRAIMEPFVLLLSPFAPHIAEELWRRLGHSKSLAYEPWPEAKEEYLKEDVIVLPVQMNGKLRGRIEVPAAADEETVFAAVISSGNFDKFLEGKDIKKKIYVPESAALTSIRLNR